LQGKGRERKEAFLLKALWLLCGYKVTGPPAAKSGCTPYKATQSVTNIIFNKKLYRILNALLIFGLLQINEK
jgi:hypothetical protein